MEKRFVQEAIELAREMYLDSTHRVVGGRESKDIVIEDVTYVLEVDAFWEKARWLTYTVKINEQLIDSGDIYDF